MVVTLVFANLFIGVLCNTFLKVRRLLVCTSQTVCVQLCGDPPLVCDGIVLMLHQHMESESGSAAARSRFDAVHFAPLSARMSHAALHNSGSSRASTASTRR